MTYQLSWIHFSSPCHVFLVPDLLLFIPARFVATSNKSSSTEGLRSWWWLILLLLLLFVDESRHGNRLVWFLCCDANDVNDIGSKTPTYKISCESQVESRTLISNMTEAASRYCHREGRSVDAMWCAKSPVLNLKTLDYANKTCKVWLILKPLLSHILLFARHSYLL